MFKCDNCGKEYERLDDLGHVWPDIPDLGERLEPGGMVPSAECEECGALVYPDDMRIFEVMSTGDSGALMIKEMDMGNEQSDIEQAQTESQPPRTPKDVGRMERAQDETAQKMGLGKDSVGNPTAEE